MSVIACTKCGEKSLKPGRQKPVLCSGCETHLINELNKIDRENNRYTKRGKIKNRLHNIPSEAIPEPLALKIEEIADPEITDRQYMVGSIEEIKKIGDKEIQSIKTNYTEKHREKIKLKKRNR